ncbi:paralemmin-3-like isoform X2 [Xenopus laevis]|nr:paralemmin-3-like isoform X2 [Xenopus laevis]OCT59398.1 hypothetical protein XELAEV_18000819mg [Xenopus laevis]
MGENQTFSRRLHEITERRNILSEVERIQKELEQKRISLQQLKRKSLRERWLMDGVVPSPGAETDNPLFQTESKIQQLEKELESLQMQLLRLETPAAVQPEAKAIQTPFLNGEKIQTGGGQTGDAKEVAAGQANTAHRIIHEEQSTKEDHVLDQDLGTDQPIPAPRGKKADTPNEDGNSTNPELKNQDTEHQKVELADLSQEHKEQSLEPPFQIQTVEHLEKNQAHPDQEHTEQKQDGQHGILEYLTQDHQLGNPNLQHLDTYLIAEVTVKHVEKNQVHPGQEKNKDDGVLEYLSQDQQNENPNLGHLEKYLVTEITVSNPLKNISVHEQSQSTSDQNQRMETKLPSDIPQKKELECQSEGKIQTVDQGSESELLHKDHSQEKVTIDQTQDLSSSSEPKEEKPKAQDEKHDHHNESASTVHEQNEVYNVEHGQLSTQGETQKPISTSEDQTQCYMSLSNAENQDQSLALSHKQVEEIPKPDEVQSEEPSLMDQISISILQSMEQNQEGAEQTSTSVAVEELSELLSSDMMKESILMSKNLEENPSMPSTEQNQETLCQAVIIPDLKKENLDPEVMQESSSHEPAPSTIPQSSSAEGNSSPESRPLLQKSQGTDSQQGSNTATPPEESRPSKKKTCQCCVVM